MGKGLEELSREAVQLPRHQRLALARFLIELEDANADADVEAAWDIEIGARLRAVDYGRAVGIPYDQVLASVEQRLGS